MDKRQLINDMKAYAKAGMMTRKIFSDYMGVKNAKNVDKYLRGLERVEGKYYFIVDLATVLKDRAVI